MSAILIHYLFFTLAVAVGCGALSGAARLMARGMRLETAETPGRSLAAGLLGAGLAGMVGQILFALLHEGLGWIGGSSMSGESTWAVVGPIVAGLGVALVIVIVGRIRRGPDQQGPPGRYGR